METVPKVVVNTVDAGGSVYPLPEGQPLDLGADVDAYMAKQRNAGLIILQDGKIPLGLGLWWVHGLFLVIGLGLMYWEPLRLKLASRRSAEEMARG